MQKVPEGSIIFQGFILTKPELEFYQLIANDETIQSAADTVLMSKRTCEDRMYKLQTHLGYTTRVALIAHLIRKKVIK